MLALDSLVDELAANRDLKSQLAHRAYLPSSPNRFATIDPPLAPALERAIRSLGIAQLWTHQAEAISAVRRGADVLVTTPTASGKSLVFQAPVLEEALAGRPGRGLFLFPLKALGQDQNQKLRQLARAAGIEPETICGIYDGDTPRKERERMRAAPPRILITNPDMLHVGILGHAAQWGEFLRELRWIVLDELHTYRGIFGCHFYHVLQRLLRVCRRYGSNPTLIASSATASNAAIFARQLAGFEDNRSFVEISESGAPREGRHFLLYQPATSPYTTTLHLFTHCLRAGLKAIVFTKARRITELLHSWLGQKEPALAQRVANYRAGFLPQERRDIEKKLFAGQLDGVISTSALEMGIDIGGLDACILVGFPGSMMATWQRSGRVGRQDRESITALVALPDALDQYLLRNPEEFLARPCEPLIVSPKNEPIGRRHLVCAAAELPLRRTDDATYLARHAPVVADLVREFELAETADGEQLRALARSPHRAVNLRGGGATYRIQSSATGHTIGTIDGARVQRECHPGAIYLHAGRQFAISELDSARRQAIAEPANVDYFTTPLTEKQTEILELIDQRSDGPLHAWLGRVRVTETVVGFERKRIASQEKLGQEALDLEPVEFETVALWFAAPAAVEETLRDEQCDFMGALHAAEHTAIALFPALALCDRGDLGGISIPYHPQVGSGAIFIYDGHAGGVGIAESGFSRLVELLDKVDDLLDSCSCEDGCPGCVQSPKCGNGNRPLDKAGALLLIRLLRGRAESRHGAIEVPSLDLRRPLEAISGRVRFETPPSAAPSGEASPLKDPRGATGFVAGVHPEHWHPSWGGRSRDLFDLGPAPIARAPGEQSHEPPGSPVRLEESTIPAPPQTSPSILDNRARRQRPDPEARHRDSHRAKRRDFVRAALPRRVQRTVLFDVETKRSAEEVGGWHRLHRLGVALAVTCSMEENRFEVYREEDVARLIEDLRAADLVIGFNVFRFDYPVLAGYTGEDFRRSLPTLDLFEQVREVVGSNVGLARLATETLGASKSADGLQSLEWYREGRFDLIEQYCRKDVELLRDLYLFGRREGYLLYRNDQDVVLRVPANWT